MWMLFVAHAGVKANEPMKRDIVTQHMFDERAKYSKRKREREQKEMNDDTEGEIVCIFLFISMHNI